MSDILLLPSYPTGSYNFIKRLLSADIVTPNLETSAKPFSINESASHPISPIKLTIAIIGGGVGGLAAAIALKQDGHNVTLYEQAPQLSEIGAGIQIPPNSSRILHSWGLQAALERQSIRPSGITWRRWQDGCVIGHAKLGSEILQKYGSPYYVTHRAHLHDALYQRTKELKVPVILNHKAKSYDFNNASVTFEDGTVVDADLVIAADGLKSIARKALTSINDKGPEGHGLAAYRCTVSMAAIKADPLISRIAQKPSLNLWVGHNRHVMAYPIAGGERYNMVLTHPEPSSTIQNLSSDGLTQMKSQFNGWDPCLMRLLDLVNEAVKWPIQSIDVPDRWASESRRTILTGDAAHAMTPYMALGAAMAVEDAAALAAALRHMSQPEDLVDIIDKWTKIRIPGVKAVHEASIAQGLIMHFADGPVQQARDVALAVELKDFPFDESPNQWSDPTMTEWVYKYDVVEAMHHEWIR
ncbi:hypothetical protein N5P37_006683 [Trichoderma harzianum]|uniref:FAD-binding domain-containing protein n=1 Tax=Trichoderma harzianum CBS 226.95 TaxID=983964 RepID=A0A2T4A335_TRIHA|nr:hypothetical protein M431DRAFT_498730 [Trichoderma harzianum CBS 226.95]KAK0760489.1 hypothetical protein N5P37_006683 [Trichoderma harzianum]PTB51485.1 hypothetical protein M431DRAFT_498730 [Trichoderma harzianum CBS 226.95]